MPPRFGTDGIRGVAGTELTGELATALGRAAARELPGRPFLVGRDTRLSGAELSRSLAAGLSLEGRDVVDVGVVPTPGLAWLASRRGLPAAMISASHNAYEDNGIKLFAPGGAKLPVDTERAVQARLDALLGAGGSRPDGRRAGPPGTVTADPDAVGLYVDHLVALVAGAAMPAGEVVVDCANGAASAVAPAVFDRLGIAHHVLFAEPDGTNINAGCGSTHLGPLQEAVVARSAALGLAFDGDADRLLAVDHTGSVVDGDDFIALFASDLRRAGLLEGGTVVVTVMSNLGLKLALKERSIDVVETPVGDRHVADVLEAGGYVLGGEQSGHVILRRHASTGDGILTALKLLELLGREGRPLAELAAEAMHRLPQVLVNVPVADPEGLESCEAAWLEAARAEDELAGSGRVLLRASGTEACVRVMVEAPSLEVAEAHAGRIAAVVERELGPPR